MLSLAEMNAAPIPLTTMLAMRAETVPARRTQLETVLSDGLAAVNAEVYHAMLHPRPNENQDFVEEKFQFEVKLKI